MNPDIKIDVDDDGIDDVNIEDIHGKPIIEFSGSLKKYGGIGGLITLGLGILYVVGKTQGWL